MLKGDFEKFLRDEIDNWNYSEDEGANLLDVDTVTSLVSHLVAAAVKDGVVR